MKIILTPIIAVLFLSYLSSNAQIPLTISLIPGDIRVYTSKKNPNIPYIIRSIVDTNKSANDMFIKVVKKGNLLDEISTDYGAWMVHDSINFLVDHRSAAQWVELFPLYIPATDTFKIYSKNVSMVDSARTAVITKRFDTTCFSKQVRAFTFRYKNASAEIEKTIADIFGLIYYHSSDASSTDTVLLNSAVLNGVKYNRDARIWNLMSLCTDNVYQRVKRYPLPPNTIMSIISMKDTLLNGEINYKLSDGTMIRKTMDGLYITENKSSQFYLPSDMSIGTPLSRSSILVDTGQIYIFGKLRQKFDFEGSAPETWSRDLFIEDFGFVYNYLWNLFDGEKSDTLKYARICGQEYGTPVGVEKEKSDIKSDFLSQNFPNPFSSSTSITYHLSSRGHVRLEVFDLLGRKVVTIVNEEKEAGEYNSKFDIRYSMFDIHSRIYFYRLTVGNNVQTKKMIVMQ